MAQLSSIEWTDATWNPVTGCSKISPGCTHCYAERIALRLQAMGQPRYRNGFKLRLQPDLLEQPLLWKTPKLVFVNSMSDLFHRDVPADFIRRAFEVMGKAHWHVFQILTKRAERLDELNRSLVPRLVEDGTAMVSSTVLRGRTVLHLCLINPQTTEEDVQQPIERLGALAEGS